MLYEIEISPAKNTIDREAQRILGECQSYGLKSIESISTARSFLIQTNNGDARLESDAAGLLVDPVVESHDVCRLPENGHGDPKGVRINVLFKPGVTDPVAESTQQALSRMGHSVQHVATCRKVWVDRKATETDLKTLAGRILANDAIERVLLGPLTIDSLEIGGDYNFELISVPIREMDDAALAALSKTGQLYLSLEEMRTIREHYRNADRDPTDCELETLAQTWSEHCSHKTLAGRIRYRDENGERLFENMLKETIFAATQTLREQAGEDDWCVSVFKDNAGIVKFDDEQSVCFKVETHNHPSALEPYGGANTGLGGVIRDPLGTGLGARPVCNTDVFCFARPDYPQRELPPGVLHPRTVMHGVVSGVRDYGNRMGIPTVNGAVFFDDRYLGNPLVYCGNVAMIPADKCDKQVSPGDLIVAVGGRTGRDGIHGATFSSAELTEESEELSGGAVQIGNAITEKMVMDVILEARDEGLYSAITDCGAGGFSSAVGEMGEECGAEVWLEKAPLKYSGLTYTEIWISEAQERMVLAVPEANWLRFRELCEREGVEATNIGRFTDSGLLILTYEGELVCELDMEFLHGGRPPVVREAIFHPPAKIDLATSSRRPADPSESLKKILASLNVASKEWIIRQYDHEVQAGSVVKPLVGVQQDGPSDAAVVRPILTSSRGLVIANGMNPHFGDHDPYWMAASAIDEALRNCVAVGADPARIAILDNFCWGNTERPETLGSLVRAAIACYDTAIAFEAPFISGKDSLNNEFRYRNDDGEDVLVVIPSSLLISALGQIDDITKAVTMDLKEVGNRVYLVGETANELGGSHFALVNDLTGGEVPRVDFDRAPKVFAAVHQAIDSGLVRSCHDLSEGGLAAAAAEMCFAGELGMELNLAGISGDLEDVALLFSESNTRFLLEVPPEHTEALESLFVGLPISELGTITNSDSLQIAADSGVLLDCAWAELKSAWQSPAIG